MPAHGFISIGGDAPVSVQTMTAGYTHEIDACVAEINRLAAAGADIVRVAVPERKTPPPSAKFCRG
jgi:(E)-4-hydroxy-3-methylbut-2-enyl-diphosphate synthase